MVKSQQVFTVRCYASVVYAMPPVSIKSCSSIEIAERIELIIGMAASFNLSYTVL